MEGSKNKEKDGRNVCSVHTWEAVSYLTSISWIHDKSHSEKLEALRITWQVLCLGEQTMVPKTRWGPRALTAAKGTFPGTVGSRQGWECGRSCCRNPTGIPTCKSYSPALPQEVNSYTARKRRWSIYITWSTTSQHGPETDKPWKLILKQFLGTEEKPVSLNENRTK